MATKKLPTIIIWDEIAFPKVFLSLDIGKKTSLKAIKKAKKDHTGYVILIGQKNTDISSPTLKELELTGTRAKIQQISEGTDGVSTISLMPVNRVVLKKFIEEKDGYYTSEYSDIAEQSKLSEKEKKLFTKVKSLVEDKLATTNIPNAILEPMLKKSNPGELCDAVAAYLPTPLKLKQDVLNAHVLEKRFNKILEILSNEANSVTIEDQIQTRVKEKLNDQQREYYLKEKLKAIKEELNDINGQESEIDGLRKRVENNPYPVIIVEKVQKELTRLENSMPSSAEANVIRTYIDWLLDIPYWQRDDEQIDIKKAKKQLDKEHFGLEKVKEKIVEFLAVKQMNPEAKGTVLTLVGPPGTGKTTLAKSIATALNRKYIKVSLGGVRDEAEVRGHRRTYIGAMPGKIITAMKKAGVINPVILLDELDKMSSDMRGDPASAMLEVLDYEQNINFQDHYIEEDYDLSRVMFVATANYYENIPEALIDRLEIVHLSSYTEIEKLNIAKNYLTPAVLENTRVDNKLFKIDDDIIKYLIRHYTREAGVRGLRRVLETLARKIIVNVLNNKIKGTLTIDRKLINKYLGPEKYDYSKKEKTNQVGVATGLAWTSVGGDILPIEVNLFPGEGKLILSGQLKDVMKESASVALAYVKSNSKLFGIEDEAFKKNDIHIHVPDGATPKDGPSAGITFTTAIISAMTNKPVNAHIGMTGEITLRGHVFPIGGLKEKSISALRSGLKTILIPKENIKDLEEIPKEVKSQLEIIAVEKYAEVYDKIFTK